MIAPTLNLPFGPATSGRKAALLTSRRLVGDTVVTFQSGFPIGVSQNVTDDAFLFGGTLRPNLVAGQDSSWPGTSPTGSREHNDNLYLNKGAFSATPANLFGNAPRMLPARISPWRNNVDLSVSKRVRTGGGTTARSASRC